MAELHVVGFVGALVEKRGNSMPHGEEEVGAKVKVDVAEITVGGEVKWD